jgi:uncharacterized membrane-anchored protein YjiN (DUF445 family)
MEQRSERIGEAVRNKLSSLTDEQWRAQIEDKVADDLQWIGVNGAMVGFLVGFLLAAIAALVPWRRVRRRRSRDAAD